jgi:DNA-binding NarL/FixJ family response regulator
MRVVVADDSLITREGVASLLTHAGFDVIGQAASGEELLEVVDERTPDMVLVDVRMPPTHTDEGLVAAREIRGRHPQIGIVVLSSHVEAGIAMRLLAETPTGLGYLLKDRVTDIDEFARTLRRVAGGGSALDPEVFTRLLAQRHDDGSLAALSGRERMVLALMAEGLSNTAIAERLSVSESAVRKHATSVFAKLGVAGGDDVNRRVLAVLSYLALDSR